MQASDVNLAIIDATAGDAGQPLCVSPASRYATPIANTPLIGHVFDELAAGGIEEVRVITQPDVRRDLGRILGAGRTWGVEVSYVDATENDGRYTVLAEVEQALARGPVLLHPGDSLFRSQVGTMRERFRAGDVDSVLPEQASIEPLRSPEARRASDTILLLGPATRPLVGDLLSPKSEGEDLVATILHSDCRLAVCEQTEHWAYSESTEALLAANRMLLDGLPDPGEHDSFGRDNRIHGRVSISPHAFLSNSVIYGPVSIDDRAIVEDSFIGPYTAIGTDAIVSGTEIDNAMVLLGAEIRHPGLRIESSIIGERSRVTRGFELPKGMHLRLGPDSRISLT
jgi:glucose-1-phosphate thymidylyltransferase